MKKVQVNEFVTKSPWSVSIRARVRFSDPREMQVDLTADYLITKDHPDKSIHSDRVMPMVSLKKFCSILKQKTKTFKAIDDSHFWVSGYYALHFYLKSKDDRLKIKKLVLEAVRESGGFMDFDTWYAKHNTKTTRIVQYNGTGSGIRQTYSNLSDTIAYL